MPIKISNIFEIVEGGQFKAELGLAGGLSAFFDMLRESPTIGNLVTLLSTPENRQNVLERVRLLAAFQIDPSYRNPQDIALAAYVWALWRTDDVGAAQVAAGIARNAPNTWWGDVVAQQVLSDARVASISLASILDKRQLTDGTETWTTSLFWTPPASTGKYVVVTQPSRVALAGTPDEAMEVRYAIPSQGRLLAGGASAFESVFGGALIDVDTKNTTTVVAG